MVQSRHPQSGDPPGPLADHWEVNVDSADALHHAVAQATAHETIDVGCMAHSATFGVATATQTDQEHESSLRRLRAEANQAWKDTNKVIFSHLLRYDPSWQPSSLLQRHVHSLVDTANIPHRICLPLALQTLDQLPAIPWNLSYCAGIP